MEQENLDAWIVLHGNKYILGYIWSLGFDLAHPCFHTLSSTESRQGVTLQRHWRSHCAPEAESDVWPWMWRASCLPELTRRLRSTETQKYLHEWSDCAKMSTQIRRQVFVGAGGEWRRKHVENDGQKSPAGISYKLHCNLLVLFVLFISRSKLEKRPGEEFGNFYDFLGQISDKKSN